MTLEQIDRLLGRRFRLHGDGEVAIELVVSSFNEHRVACCHVRNATPARQHIPGDMLIASINAGVLEEL